MANFERPRMNANSLLASPTGLSPYLRFGCLSSRLFYFKLTDLYRKVSINLPNPNPELNLKGRQINGLVYLLDHYIYIHTVLCKGLSHLNF